MKQIYSSNITPEMNGQEVVLTGWAHEVRDLGGVVFLVLRDREGFVQVTLVKKLVDKALFKKVREMSRESVVMVRGRVKAELKAPNGFEILPDEVEVINQAASPLPLDPTEKVPAELDTRLDSRYMDLRRPRVQAIFKLKSRLLQATREYLLGEGFVEVHTPKIVAAATEGGTALFPISYFEREAFLSQSPQLYKQILMATGLDRVFEIAPAFRAEEHNTTRHLNEFLSIDIEVAFASDKDVMEILEKVIQYQYEQVSKHCQKELAQIGAATEIPALPFKRITYDEAIEIVRKRGIKIEWGEDFTTEAEKATGEEISGFYFITDFPSEIKPFYAMPHEDNPKLSHSFDLLYNGREMTSGARRVHEYELLKQRLIEKGLDPQRFEFYLNAFKYGMPPHAGWAIGTERLAAAMIGAENVREVVLFPRDRRRITP